MRSACQKLGIQPYLAYFNGGGDPLAYVESKNLHRRDLADGERAIAAAKLATLKHGNVKAQQADGPIGLSNAEAAKKLGISEMTVKRARVVLTGGTPEDIAAVESGAKAVSAVAKNIRDRKRCAAKKAASRQPVP